MLLLRRIVPVHPHATTVVDDLDTIHVATVGLDLLGAEDLAAALGAADRLGELAIAVRLVLLLLLRLRALRTLVARVLRLLLGLRLRLRPRGRAGARQGDGQLGMALGGRQAHGHSARDPGLLYSREAILLIAQ